MYCIVWLIASAVPQDLLASVTAQHQLPPLNVDQPCQPRVRSHAGGLVYGFVGAGGNTGGAITQAIFFTPHNLAPYDSFKWLGWVLSVTHRNQ